MKATVLSPSAVGGFHHGVREGKVTKKSRDPAVTEEMQLYFAKLKELVPFMPKNKKVSKLEIIQCVIDYICDLQGALEVQHPVMREAADALFASSIGSPTVMIDGAMSLHSGLQSPRQPLGVIENSLNHVISGVSQLTHESAHTSDKFQSSEMYRSVSC